MHIASDKGNHLDSSSNKPLLEQTRNSATDKRPDPLLQEPVDLLRKISIGEFIRGYHLDSPRCIVNKVNLVCSIEDGCNPLIPNGKGCSHGYTDAYTVPIDQQ
jgi:hypothetical protein